MLYGLSLVAALILWVYCLVEVISTDESLIRNLPKPMWVFVVLLFPVIGSLLWLLLGRPENAPLSRPPSGRARRSPPPRPRGPIAPEDSPDWSERFRRTDGDDRP